MRLAADIVFNRVAPHVSEIACLLRFLSVLITNGFRLISKARVHGSMRHSTGPDTTALRNPERHGISKIHPSMLSSSVGTFQH